MNNIQNLRRQKLMSQKELAKKVGISRSYLSEVENSKSVPNAILSILIAKALKTTVEKIFTQDVQRVEQA